MYWVNENSRRYYHVALQRDLLGDLVVVRTTGSQDSLRGRTMSFPVKNYNEARRMLEEVVKDRKRHGYKLVPLEYPPP